MTAPRILVVEDNPIDVRLIKRALKVGGIEDEPLVLNDGALAISLLNREKDYEHIPLPDLVLLDLNLITIDGGQMLSFIRQTPALDNVSVAILSSTPHGTARKHHAQADCYFVKPSELAAFEQLGKKILECYARSKHNPYATLKQ